MTNRSGECCINNYSMIMYLTKLRIGIPNKNLDSRKIS